MADKLSVDTMKSVWEDVVNPSNTKSSATEDAKSSGGISASDKEAVFKDVFKSSSKSSYNPVKDLSPFVKESVFQEVFKPKEIDYRGAYNEAYGGKFQRTIDADTLDLSRGGVRTSTRFAGIDAPESSQSLGPVAHKYLDKLIKENGPITIGSQGKDMHGRDVSILYSGDKNLNVELVRSGNAKVYRNYLNTLSKDMQKKLLDAEESAKKAQIGVWKPGNEQMDSEAYRRELGAENAFKGHDMRKPIDEWTVTRAQVFREVFGDGSHHGGLPGFGGGKSGSSGSSSGEGSYIKNSDKYQKEEGWLDRVFGALDYAGNISRSSLKGVAEGKWGDKLSTAFKYGSQAAGKERYTSSSNLKDTITQDLGLGKIRFGKDDGDFQVGDVADFSTDLLLDVFTDPISFVSMGVGKLAKGGSKLAKALPAVHTGAIDAKIGQITPDAIKYLKAQTAARATIGGIYGAGVTDDEDDIGTKILAAAGGAMLGVVSNKVPGAAAKYIKPKLDKASSAYATYTRGSKYLDFPQAKQVATRAYDKVRNIAEWIRQGKFAAMDEITDPVDRIRTANVMSQLKTEFIRRRKVIEKAYTKGNKETRIPKSLDHVFNKKITKDIEEFYLPALLEQEKENVAKAVIKWGDHNTNVIKKLNKEVFGLKDGVPIDGKGIFGIKWHVDDVYEKKAFRQSEEVLGRRNINKAEMLERSDAPFEIAIKNYAKETGKNLTVDDAKYLMNKGDKEFSKYLSDAMDSSYGTYTETFSKQFLDETESKAVDLMIDYSNAIPKQKTLQGFETMLKYTDQATNFIKANMLYFSMSWLKNNYFDNLAKSYLESGLQGIVDSATLGKLQKGLSEDVWDLYSQKGIKGVYGKRAPKELQAELSKNFQDALHRGVLDNPMFKSLKDEGTRAYLFSPDQIKLQGSKNPLDLLQRAGDIWFDGKFSPLRKVQQVGSHMEGTARMMTYLRVKDSLLSSPRFKGATGEELARVKDIAADVVSRTFFDYGDVTHFENAVFKRLVPFYSFYSKNMPYWLNAVFDPEKVGRLLALEKARRNVGEDPSESDKSGMSKYLIDSGARKLGREKGKTKYGIFPSGSMYDAFKQINPLEWADEVINKGHPVPKAAYELVSGQDLFDGSNLYPSDSRANKKFLFSRGFKHVPLGNAKVDSHGNPYTEDDTVVTLDKIVSTLWPHGFVDQVAGTTGKIATGKETVAEGLMNRLSPMQTVKVSDAYSRMIKLQKAKEKEKQFYEGR